MPSEELDGTMIRSVRPMRLRADNLARVAVPGEEVDVSVVERIQIHAAAGPFTDCTVRHLTESADFRGALTVSVCLPCRTSGTPRSRRDTIDSVSARVSAAIDSVGSSRTRRTTRDSNRDDGAQ